jgi:hypothetical protein
MMKTSLVACALVATGSSALAGGQEGSLGIGAEYMMNGLTGGVSINYDLGKMHVGGFLGLFDPGDDTTDLTIGGRFFYHLHSTAMSDFGIGAGLGFYSDEFRAGNDTDRDTYLFLEPGVQIRVFLAANVALSFGAGIVIGLQDEDGIAIGGGLVKSNDAGLVTGSAGIHYYFF